MNTLGQQIGVVERTFSTKNEAGDKVTITARFDFTNASDETIKDWLAANRAINYQNSTLRKLSKGEIKALDGQTVVCDGAKRARTQIDPMTSLTNKAKAKGIDVNDDKAMAKFFMDELKASK